MAIPVISATAVGARNVIGFLADLPKQQKYAIARALQDSAYAARTWTIKELLPSKFTLRAKKKPWQEFGKYRFKVEPRRVTRETKQVTLSSSAPWIYDHEHGGVRHGPKTDSGLMGQPINVSARPAPTSVIPTRLMPKKAAKRKTTFYRSGKNGKGMYIKERKQTPRLLYWLSDAVRIPKTLGFEKDAPKIAVKHFPGAFRTQFRDALRDSARRNGLKP